MDIHGCTGYDFIPLGGGEVQGKGEDALWSVSLYD